MKTILLVLALLVVVAPVTAADKGIPHSRLPPCSAEHVARLLDPKAAEYAPLLACRIMDKAAFDHPAAAFRLYQLLYTGTHGLKAKPDLADYWLVQASNAMHPPAMKEFGRRLLLGEGMPRRQIPAFELLYAARMAGEEVGSLLDQARGGLPQYVLDAAEADGGRSVTTYAYSDAPRLLSQPACESSS